MCNRECERVILRSNEVLDCPRCPYDGPKPRTDIIISVETVASDEPAPVAEPTKEI